MHESWAGESDPDDFGPEGLGRWAERPGTISLGSGAIALAGLVVTLLLSAMLLDLYSVYCHGKAITLHQQLWFQAPTVAIAGFFARQLRKESSLGFSLRVAFSLPFIHLLFLALGAGIWARSTQDDPYLASHFSILDFLPAAAIAVGLAVLLLLALLIRGAITEGRKQPAILYPISITLLLFTLVLGLWLPIVLAYESPFILPDWDYEVLAFRERFLWICLLPPAIAAVAIGLSASRLARLSKSYGLKLFGGSLFVIVVMVALEARATADVEALVAYANLVPLLLCLALLSLLAIVAVTLSHWQALRATRGSEQPAPWSQEGEVVLLTGTRAPGRIKYLNWFWGLRTSCDRFVLRTPAGDILIPRGARLIAKIPLWTSRANPGESAPLLRTGDRVRATGFVAPPKGNAYRQSLMPIPGSRGLVVTTLEAEATRVSTDLALLLWRPAILYLAVVSLVALPGLAGYFAL